MAKIKSPIKIPDKYVTQINFSGLVGRQLHLPAPRNPSRVFVCLYGQHAALERMYAVARLLNEYGEVLMPDLPGFGGMSSFYSISKEPSWDNYADYLYTYLKTKHLNKDITFFASSFSAQVVTRMLEKYPDSQGWVRDVIAIGGFASASDFKITARFKWSLYALIYPASTRLGSWVMQRLFFNTLGLKVMLKVFSRTKAKMQNDDDNLKKDMIQMEGYLWSVNDRRTHARTARIMFRNDLRKVNKAKIPLNLYNIVTSNDQYFDNIRVQRSFEELYASYIPLEMDSHVHVPSMIADKETVRKMLSKETLNLLES